MRYVIVYVCILGIDDRNVGNSGGTRIACA